MEAKKLNFRSVVFKRAYLIVKQTGCNFAQALAEAWKRYRAFKTKTIEELTEQIKGFDFYYHMSDDSREHRYWSKLQIEIRSQIRSLPSSFLSAISNHFNSKQIRLFI